MKYLISFIVFLVIFMKFSCKQEKNLHEELNLHADVKRLINIYIEGHPQFNTFILESTQELEQNETTAVRQGFLLGPGYASFIEKSNPTFYFNVLDKRIFYISSIDKLIQKRKKIIKNNEPDSIKMSNEWVIKESSELFIYRSIYFYYDELGNIEVNLRPDTIFAPKCLDSSIQFENIIE